MQFPKEVRQFHLQEEKEGKGVGGHTEQGVERVIHGIISIQGQEVLAAIREVEAVREVEAILVALEEEALAAVVPVEAGKQFFS